MFKKFEEFNGHYHDINTYLLENFNYDLMNEGLIRSADYDISIEKFNNLLKKYKLKGNSHLYPYKDRIQLDVYGLGFMKNVKNFYNEFKSLLNLLGYYVSAFSIDDDISKKQDVSLLDFFNNDALRVWINKKFDYEKGTPEKLYHITYKKNINNIQKKGLIPKSKSLIENHPDRIYLFFDVDDAKNFTVLRGLYSDDLEFVLLEIDTKLLKYLKLYQDPKFGKNILAFYTYDNIPPNSLKIVEEL